MTSPTISVIVPTLGRVAEVEALLVSLGRSSHRPHEILLMDQNGSDLLDDIVARHAPELPIRHVRIGTRGTSKAKNFGARLASGELFCFPDDDSELLPETLARALEVLESSRADVVFGRSVDLEGRISVKKYDDTSGPLTMENHYDRFVDFTIFIPKPVFERFPYDETLGVGQFHGAEEGHDQVLRMLKGGVSMFYSPDIVFVHSAKITSHETDGEIRRVFGYRCGFARLCLKHRMYGAFASRLFKVSLYLMYLLVFNRRQARYYGAEWLGLLAGVVVP